MAAVARWVSHGETFLTYAPPSDTAIPNQRSRRLAAGPPPDLKTLAATVAPDIGSGPAVLADWHAGMVFVADDLAAWLVGLLADAGHKKLTSLILGGDQERALRSAATAAVQRTANELRPGDEQRAEQLAIVISEVFSRVIVNTCGSRSLGCFRRGLPGGLVLGSFEELAVDSDRSWGYLIRDVRKV